MILLRFSGVQSLGTARSDANGREWSQAIGTGVNPRFPIVRFRGRVKRRERQSIQQNRRIDTQNDSLIVSGQRAVATTTRLAF
jgi:hypothetical protein